MIYAEAAYFDGYHFQHIAAYQDHLRLKRIAKTNAEAYRMIERRTIRVRAASMPTHPPLKLVA